MNVKKFIPLLALAALLLICGMACAAEPGIVYQSAVYEDDRSNADLQSLIPGRRVLFSFLIEGDAVRSQYHTVSMSNVDGTSKVSYSNGGSLNRVPYELTVSLDVPKNAKGFVRTEIFGTSYPDGTPLGVSEQELKTSDYSDQPVPDPIKTSDGGSGGCSSGMFGALSLILGVAALVSNKR